MRGSHGVVVKEGLKKASETRQLVYTVTLRISRLSIVRRDNRAAFYKRALMTFYQATATLSVRSDCCSQT